MRNLLLAILSLIVALELAGWLSTRYLSIYYSNWESIENTIRNVAQRDKSQLRSARARLTNPDYTPAPVTRRETNCVGETVTYTDGSKGERRYTGFSPKKSEVMLIGDSYTYGTDVNDNYSIAAHMARSGLMVANLGHRGYDPLQALLHAKHWLPEYPQVKVVVLGIMYENINRLATSYWPVYTKAKANRIFEFKPYMKNGETIMIDPHIFDSVESITQAARHAFENDYWARPEPGFPYSLSLMRLLANTSFHHSMLMRIGARQGENYRYQFENEELSSNLRSVLTQFAQWAEQEKLTHIVFFIPRSASDTTSGEQWIQRNRAQLPPSLQLYNVDFSTIKSEDYNQRHNGNCHPSSYGYSQIARQYLDVVIPALQQAGRK